MKNYPEVLRTDQLKSLGLSLVCCVLLVFILGCITMRTDIQKADAERMLVIREESGSDAEAPAADVRTGKGSDAADPDQEVHTHVNTGGRAQPAHPQILTQIVGEPAAVEQRVSPESMKPDEGPGAGENGIDKNAPATSEPISGAFLSHRKLTAPATLSGTEQEEGIVAVNITVDQDGRVTEATAISKGSTITDRKLWSKAQQAALSARFDKSREGIAEQHGVYYFRFAFL